jgi:hypothetical protein
MKLRLFNQLNNLLREGPVIDGKLNIVMLLSCCQFDIESDVDEHILSLPTLLLVYADYRSKEQVSDMNLIFHLSSVSNNT